MADQANTPNTLPEEKELPTWKVLFYALGNAGNLLTYYTFNTYVQFFYTDRVGLPSNWVGRGWFAFGFWNAINDPIGGWLSDNTQSKIGRRTFYIRLLAIPVAISFAFIWLPPFSIEEAGATAMMVYFLVIISIYDMLQSVITLNQDALFPEMFNSSKARARGAAIRQFVGFGLGGSFAVALTPLVFDSSLGWSGLALLWGTLAAFFYFLSLIGIEENPAYGKKSQEEQKSGLNQFVDIGKNKIFWIVIVINFVFRFVLGVLTVSLPFYAKYVLFLEERQTSLLAGAFIVTVTISLFVWQYIFRRIGTRKTMILSLLSSAVLAFPIIFTTSLTSTVIALITLGLVVGGISLGPDLMFAEMIDEDFVRTGLRREGVYRGVLGFIYRFPPAFAGLILGELLTTTGYDNSIDPLAQPEAVEAAIRSFTAIGPILAVLFGAGLMLFYPLYGNRLETIKSQAATLRQQIASQATLDEEKK